MLNIEEEEEKKDEGEERKKNRCRGENGYEETGVEERIDMRREGKGK